jgi:hypothetical protein
VDCDIFCGVPFYAAFEAGGDCGCDFCGEGEGEGVRFEYGDYVLRMEKDPECIATDGGYF